MEWGGHVATAALKRPGPPGLPCHPRGGSDPPPGRRRAAPRPEPEGPILASATVTVAPGPSLSDSEGDARYEDPGPGTQAVAQAASSLARAARCAGLLRLPGKPQCQQDHDRPWGLGGPTQWAMQDPTTRILTRLSRPDYRRWWCHSGDGGGHSWHGMILLAVRCQRASGCVVPLSGCPQPVCLRV